MIGSHRCIRRSADENLRPHLNLSPAIPAAQGRGEGTIEFAGRLKGTSYFLTAGDSGKRDEKTEFFFNVRSLGALFGGRDAVENQSGRGLYALEASVEASCRRISRIASAQIVAGKDGIDLALSATCWISRGTWINADLVESFSCSQR